MNATQNRNQPHARPYLSQRLIRGLDRVGKWLGRESSQPSHLQVGRAGEEAAFFHLRRLGYVIVARNWRTQSLRGDLDLVGWHEGTLCFIEVKTRSQRDIVPAEFAIDDAKQRMLRRMAQAWVRHSPVSENVPKRFDAVAVYPTAGQPEVEVFRNAFSWQRPSSW
jgi:putative endonuclease